MPIYEFTCNACGSEFELVMLPGEKSAPRCPDCGGAELEKRFSVFSTPRNPAPAQGRTCCGREERCASPPCEADGSCGRA